MAEPQAEPKGIILILFQVGARVAKDVRLGVSFSKQFNVPEQWFLKNKVFDPTLDMDSLLFVDPFLLSSSSHPEFRECAHQAYISHFKKIYSLLRASKEEGDKAWTGALRLFQQSEKRGLSGTCLGHSKKSTRGHAFGPKLAKRSLVWAQDVIALGVDDPELFLSLPLFESGIGADLISDMVVGIAISCVLQFNKRMLSKMHQDLGKRIPTKVMEIAGIEAELAINPYAPDESGILLVADDILKHLPILSDAKSLRKTAEFNTEFRDRVNAGIGEIFRIRSKEDKKEVKRQAMESAQAFQTLLDLLKLVEKTSYDVNKDPFGLVQWRHVGRQLAQTAKVCIADDVRKPRLERLKHVAEIVINEFKTVVEKNRMSRLFHVDGKPRHERFAQMVFLLVARSWCEANGLDISPESDMGAGPVDFKFSDGAEKVVVEVKLSTNSHVVGGFETQLTIYEEAEQADFGHFVLIDVGELGQQWDRVKSLHKSNRKFAKLRTIHLVDGKLKESASKRGR